MKEAVFVHQNRVKWKHYEGCLKNANQQSPDTLADIYIDITNDLSFAQSHYPRSLINNYLNSLAAQLHQFIHRRKKEKFSRILTFWAQEFPEVMFLARKELLYSFLIFAVSILIGAFSTANDDSFNRLILGDRYVEMTLENIAKGDPMAVYKDSHKGSMFTGITVNNIRVSFIIFASAIFTSITSAYLLVRNGIMLGCFQYFFYEHGLLWDSFLTIWIHGTLEISAIIVAGAAGIIMGNSWLFPGTYKRTVSFRRGAKKGVKIIVGTIPIFIIAGFLESFVTRHTELPEWIRLAIIIMSLSFVVFYYIVYPAKVAKSRHNTEKSINK
ncbi:MAG: stage II sporulation protein M [Dysgonamonadaceae bacterium]|jgi:uncharacterized membrane protein SpoIIM required for sporulation|nr:stage II sporulation protein M [Dysgonamonadaceae bacterium]